MVPDEAGSRDVVQETRTYRYMADRRTPNRTARAMMLLVFRAGKAFPLIFAGVGLIILVEALQGDWYWVLTLTGVLLFLPLFMWWTMRRQCAGVVQAWQPLETVFGANTLVIRTGIGTTELPLSSVKALREVSDFVAVQQDHVKLHSLLPREVFPSEERERIQRLLEARAR